MSNRSPDRSVPDTPAPGRGASRAASLVGRRVVAAIGEPWDFTSTAGDNVLVGQITAVSPATEPVEWIVCAVSSFDVGGVTVSTVAAVRRYAGEEPIQQLQRHGEAHVHLLYDPTGATLTAARIHDALRAGHGGLKHLVGSLRFAGG
jgi:hypothetical protein